MHKSIMPRNTIILGAVLIALGLIAYLASGLGSWTALIPSILGALLLICGLVGLRSPRVGIHIALALALLGAAGTFMNVLQLGELFAGTAERPLAVVASTITFVLLIIYIILGIRSFVSARRWQTSEENSQRG